MVTVACAGLLVPAVLAAGVAATPGTPAGASQQAHVYPDAGMIGFGSVSLSDPQLPQPLNSPVFSGAATPDGSGYVLASGDGGVFAFGDATFQGSAGDLPLNGPIVAMATTSDAKGYWLGALDGGVFAYGDAPFYGSMGSTPLNQPIVGMASTSDGKGYWLVAADGGIFSYGDAGFYGSTGSLALNAPIVGMAPTHDGKGYWLVAADGGIFPYGDAGFYGSAGSENLPDPVVGMVASPDGGGYLMATANGVVLPFGDAQAFGGSDPEPHGNADLGHHRQQPRDRVLAARPAGLAVQLHDPDPRAHVPPVAGHRRRRRLADPARSEHVARCMVQSLRALRAVVRSVRHLGLGAGGRPDPSLRLHRRHVALGRRLRRRPSTDGDAGGR